MRRFAEMFVPTIMLGALLIPACSKDQPPPPPTPSVAPLAKAPTDPGPQPGTAALPPGHPPIDGAPVATGTAPNDAVHGGMPGMPEMPPVDEARKLLDKANTQFAGIMLTPPDGWKAYDTSGGSMAPVAAFVLERADGDAADATARLTHFPGMKNIPLEMNLERWYGQVKQPDGRPTKEVAKLETLAAGQAKITVIDMSGAIGGSENQRMIAAVIEHPQGPHFLKVVGPEATVAKWRDSVMSYLQGTKITP